jgi:hypothetical protein
VAFLAVEIHAINKIEIAKKHPLVDYRGNKNP